MRFSSIISSASLFLFAATAIAQANNAPVIKLATPPGNVVLKARLPSTGCPVSVSARQQAVGQNLSIGGGHRSAPGDHGLALQFGEPEGAAIVGATVRVWGLSPRGRFLTAANGSDPDVSREFDLKLAGSKGLSDVWMSGVSALTRVDVSEIRYADGSVWRATEKAHCTATPDGMLPIASLH